MASDGMLAKMMEILVLPKRSEGPKRFDWAVDGAKGRTFNTITTCALGPEQWEKFNLDLQAKFGTIRHNKRE